MAKEAGEIHAAVGPCDATLARERDCRLLPVALPATSYLTYPPNATADHT